MWISEFCPDCVGRLMHGFIDEYEQIVVSYPLYMLGKSDRVLLQKVQDYLASSKHMSLCNVPKKWKKKVATFNGYEKQWNCHVLWNAFPDEGCALLFKEFEETTRVYKDLLKKDAPKSIRHSTPVEIKGQLLYATYNTDHQIIVLSETPHPLSTRDITYVFVNNLLIPGLKTALK